MQENLVVAADFKDHFSDASDSYAKYRPTYPVELFHYLAGISPARDRAWDCATGSGQVAVALADTFTFVSATDASATQIEAAHAHPRVEYTVAPAEDSGLASDSFDLVTVGQAFHWFDADSFISEASRVLRPDGALAIWCYETCTVNEECDAVIDHLYSDITGEFWPPERKMIEDGYQSIELPGARIDAPEFEMTLEWTADEMLGYLGTWSASRRYAAANGHDPVALIGDSLRQAWVEHRRAVSWPLRLRVCRPNAVD